MFYFTINLERQKLKLPKAKQNVCNADADAYISKWSCETTVTRKIQVQETEAEHYSQNILRLLNSRV